MLKIGNVDVGYTTDMPTEYVALIRAACDLDALRQAVALYAPFARDAEEQAATMTAADWPDWLRFVKIRCDNRYGRKTLDPYMDRFGAILLPESMLQVQLVASHFGAPWGCAAIQMANAGVLTDVNGYAVVDMQAGKVAAA